MAQVYTTAARVIAYESTLTSFDSATLDDIIEGVSQRMSDWMDRLLTYETVGDEFESNGTALALVLTHWPATQISAVDGDRSLLDAAALTLKRDRELYKQSSTDRYPTAWLSGTVIVSYQAGYSADVDDPGFPKSIVDAATRQVVAEAKQSEEHRIGVESVTQQTGQQETFNADGWLPSVVDAMRPYRRLY